MTPEKKLEAFESLLNELSGGLAEVVEVMKDKSEAGAMEEISATLVEMLEVIKAAPASQNLDGLVAAIKALRITAPDVHVKHEVTVQPAAVQVIDRPARAFKIHSLTYDRTGRLESATVSPV